MRGCTRGAQPARFLALAGIALLALGAAVLPAAAADPEYKGWFAALDFALTQPNSLDQDFASEWIPTGTVSGSMTRLVIDNDADSTLRFSVGYSFGKGLGSLQASYWSFDNEDSVGGASSGYLVPTIFGSDGSSYYYYLWPGTVLIPPSAYTATAGVSAKVTDLDYVRPIPVGDKFTVKWLAGLRLTEFEEDQSFTGVGALYYTYTQDKHIKSDAAGLKVGVTGVFGFSKHFSLEASIAGSFLQGDTEAEAHETDDYWVVARTHTTSDDNVSGEIRDYDLRAVWSGYAAGHLDWYLGYSSSIWSGLVADPLPAMGTGVYLADPSGDGGRDTISFNSLHAGVLYRFGRPRAAPKLPVP